MPTVYFVTTPIIVSMIMKLYVLACLEAWINMSHSMLGGVIGIMKTVPLLFKFRLQGFAGWLRVPTNTVP